MLVALLAGKSQFPRHRLERIDDQGDVFVELDAEFRGALPNPHQEQKVINLHRNLDEWCGTGD